MNNFTDNPLTGLFSNIPRKIIGDFLAKRKTPRVTEIDGEIELSSNEGIL